MVLIVNFSQSYSIIQYSTYCTVLLDMRGTDTPQTSQIIYIVDNNINNTVQICLFRGATQQ